MGGGHRPLVHTLLGPLLELGLSAESTAFVLGSGGSLLSDVCGLLSTWLMFFVAVMFFYHIFAPLARSYHARKFPDAPTSKVPQSLIQNMIDVSHRAFPLYITVPMLSDLFKTKGWSMTCDSLEECGGWGPALLSCAAYFFALEAFIYFDHYYLLHKWNVGKRLGQHAFHHVYKYADQLNAFSGYAFAPQDGWSQGLPLALCTLFIPVPLAFHYAMEILTGFWTLYIHTDATPLPWPFMGCDYHYIHHRYNWYNFGFMTVFFDTVFKTVKHPKKDALALAHGTMPMPDWELAKSKALTKQILQQRGADALAEDDAAGDAMVNFAAARGVAAESKRD